jgi:hypothetical protein
MQKKKENIQMKYQYNFISKNNLFFFLILDKDGGSRRGPFSEGFFYMLNFFRR